MIDNEIPYFERKEQERQLQNYQHLEAVSNFFFFQHFLIHLHSNQTFMTEIHQKFVEEQLFQNEVQKCFHYLEKTEEKIKEQKKQSSQDEDDDDDDDLDEEQSKLKKKNQKNSFTSEEDEDLSESSGSEWNDDDIDEDDRVYEELRTYFKCVYGIKNRKKRKILVYNDSINNQNCSWITKKFANFEEIISLSKFIKRIYPNYLTDIHQVFNTQVQQLLLGTFDYMKQNDSYWALCDGIKNCFEKLMKNYELPDLLFLVGRAHEDVNPSEKDTSEIKIQKNQKSALVKAEKMFTLNILLRPQQVLNWQVLGGLEPDMIEEDSKNKDQDSNSQTKEKEKENSHISKQINQNFEGENYDIEFQLEYYISIFKIVKLYLATSKFLLVKYENIKEFSHKLYRDFSVKFESDENIEKIQDITFKIFLPIYEQIQKLMENLIKKWKIDNFELFNEIAASNNESIDLNEILNRNNSQLSFKQYTKIIQFLQANQHQHQKEQEEIIISEHQDDQQEQKHFQKTEQSEQNQNQNKQDENLHTDKMQEEEQTKEQKENNIQNNQQIEISENSNNITNLDKNVEKIQNNQSEVDINKLKQEIDEKNEEVHKFQECDEKEQINIATKSLEDQFKKKKKKIVNKNEQVQSQQQDNQNKMQEEISN
ncbi:hypothetical protein PPERSA_01881 [Pseudocohnilembus persalinus]|uniref:Uncharacterized protein n=1 Tax=Pseudocohnilembus persalinus TaxID=266149 RepID=A0A0V0R268_PSEPJ|nr:hypothetical protein PPERSA_01881 [Pseudocohnilembus persalinus]|eukprot:KRX08628.1 hypothetical protein PPERSA_01881 [Pseudocohnilembus persalinus]